MQSEANEKTMLPQKRLKVFMIALVAQARLQCFGGRSTEAYRILGEEGKLCLVAEKRIGK
jgi:hypothetical protein